LQKELRHQILVLDRLLNKLGRVPSAPRLDDRERFNLARAAHHGGYEWVPEEWIQHAGHVPAVPDRFIPMRLMAAARPTPDLWPPLPPPKMTDIRQRHPAAD
jgi:hypothetical protein